MDRRVRHWVVYKISIITLATMQIRSNWCRLSKISPRTNMKKKIMKLISSVLKKSLKNMKDKMK